jgi:hypothetical protein
MKYFKISKWRILVGLIIMCVSEFISIKILTMPYVELDANADKYHPIVAYMFFGPIALLLAILITINVVFCFQKGKGLHLTSTGIIGIQRGCGHNCALKLGSVKLGSVKLGAGLTIRAADFLTSVLGV